ncbi:hypothetical protein [Subtercola boreus]|uniref:Sel1 repeat family protein n=1 Tax=Subtercola boreus TaxID=120213 RepID=A0A3E0WF14_9MICO|nr:hypothetical protein [Subtercola boreus]RFA22022.1 hypothetical protein B7R24_04860 [Subtercola boreus]RFA22202.1 hypothetical protein B7R23_04805 [Subtercola boreus]RFA28064.1 hypothetical protein B7R25_04930 [Subtercola boreus]
MNSRPDFSTSLTTLLVAEDRGSPCAEQALIEFAQADPAAGRSLAAIEYSLALRYLDGEGVACDLGLAQRHFENAAVFGHPFPDALRWVDC